MRNFRRFHSNQHHEIAIVGSVAIAVWKTEATLLGVSKTVEALDIASENGRRPVAVIGVIMETCAPPPPEVRKAFVALYNNPERPIRAAALVVQMGGFQGTAMRAVIAGIAAFAKSLIRVFADVNPAVDFLAEQLRGAEDVSASDIVAATEELIPKAVPAKASA